MYCKCKCLKRGQTKVEVNLRERILGKTNGNVSNTSLTVSPPLIYMESRVIYFPVASKDLVGIVHANVPGMKRDFIVIIFEL